MLCSNHGPVTGEYQLASRAWIASSRVPDPGRVDPDLDSTHEKKPGPDRPNKRFANLNISKSQCNCYVMFFGK